MLEPAAAYLAPLLQQLEAQANPVEAAAMARYMRDQFPFYGIKTPQRRLLVRQFLDAHGRPPPDLLEPVILNLWQRPQRECQYIAVGLLEKGSKRLPTPAIPLVEQLIITKSWWDTVDALAGGIAGEQFHRFPESREAVLPHWRTSDNMWLRRSAILFQLGYKAETDAALLLEIVQENRHSSEFFIQKAIGWALREYSKTNPNLVVDFVQRSQLAPLSQREALKWLGKKGASTDDPDVHR
ncbi:MAG: DNA alkylation repair protein [Anaerolineae bacterium]|nr:DNA alkylation repair protein [Anaerolineae bacterium]